MLGKSSTWTPPAPGGMLMCCDECMVNGVWLGFRGTIGQVFHCDGIDMPMAIARSSTVKHSIAQNLQCVGCLDLAACCHPGVEGNASSIPQLCSTAVDIAF